MNDIVKPFPVASFPASSILELLIIFPGQINPKSIFLAINNLGKAGLGTYARDE